MLEVALDRARERLKAHCKPFNFKDTVWRTEYQRAESEVLNLERQISALKGEEHAVPLDFPYTWDVGAPLPQLLTNDYKAILIFYRRIEDPTWNGTTCRVVDPASPVAASLVMVEFTRCTSSKLGGPNDEVFLGHPLSGRGGDAYTAQEVINSRWIKEIQAINSVHSQYLPERWKQVRHFIFWFHDSTFECLAHSFSAELHDKSMRELMQYACLKLTG